jgi:hypothetical protein
MPTRLFILNAPRHPLLRFLLGLLGLAVLGTLIVFGFFAFLALAAIGAVLMLVRAWRMRHHGSGPDAPEEPAQETDVLEGEYVVIRKHRDTPHS